MIHHNLGHVSEAIADYPRALEADPHDMPAIRDLAEAWIWGGQAEQAERRLDALLAREPDSLRGYLRHAARSAQGDFAAEADLDVVLRGAPDDGEARDRHGVLRWERGRAQEAIADWEQALGQDPDAAWAADPRARLTAAR